MVSNSTNSTECTKQSVNKSTVRPNQQISRSNLNTFSLGSLRLATSDEPFTALPNSQITNDSNPLEILHDQLLHDHKEQQEQEFEPIDNSQQINNSNYTSQVSNVNALSIQDDINVRYSDNFGYFVHDFNISNPSEPLRLSQVFEQSQASINLLESLSNHCQQQQNYATFNSLKSTNKGLMHVQDTETKTIYLIDNGAEKSIVPRTYEEEIEPCNIKLFSPINSQFKVYGTKDIIVTLSNRPYQAKVIVADINYPILGIDFLKENKMIIDLDQYTIMSKNDNIIHRAYKRKQVNLIQSTNDYSQINQLLNEFEK